jgi:hypothetical protein
MVPEPMDDLKCAWEVTSALNRAGDALIAAEIFGLPLITAPSFCPCLMVAESLFGLRVAFRLIG